MSEQSSRRRRGVSRVARTLEVGSEVFLAAAVVSAPLMIASVHLWAAAVGLGLCGAALLATAAGGAITGRALHVPWVAVAFAGVVLFEVLQIVPLPPWVISTVSPAAADLYGFVLTDLDGWPAWRTISLDPIQTGLEVARHLSWIALLIVTHDLARERRRRRRLLAILVLSGVVVVVLAFGQKLLGFDEIFGFYSTPPSGWLFASFGNSNHLAAHLDLLAPLALGLAMASRDRNRAALWGLAFVLMAAACLLTLSRGGMVALVVGITVFLALRRQVRADQEDLPSSRWRVATPLLVGLGLLVGGYLAFDAILQEALTLVDREHLLNESRWPLWRQTVRIFGDFPATGIGRGAFGVVSPLYWSNGVPRTALFAENQVLQAFAELGVVGALAFLLAPLLAWIRTARTVRSVRECAVLAGLLGLAIHELADFSTSYGGVAVPATVALGLLGARARGVRLGGWAALAVAGLGIGTAVGLVIAASGALRDDVLASMQRPGDRRADIAVLAAGAMRQRPSDHMPALVVADRLMRERGRDSEAMWWVTRAMYLSPYEPRGHLVAAELLSRAGRKEQALLEYRLAARWGHSNSDILARAAVRYAGASDLRRALPDDAHNASAVVLYLLGKKRFEDAWNQGRLALEAHPEDLRLHAVTARSGVAYGQFAQALAIAEKLTEIAPRDPRGPLWSGRALLRMGEVDRAISTLREGLGRAPGNLGLGMILARALLTRRDDPDAAWEVIRNTTAPRNPSARAGFYLLRGDILRARLEYGRAIAAYEVAARALPQRPVAHQRIGDVYLGLDRPADALAAYEEALARMGGAATAGLESRIDRALRRIETRAP